MGKLYLYRRLAAARVCVVDQAGRDVRPECGRAERDDLSLAVSQLPTEARGASPPQDQPRKSQGLRSRYTSLTLYQWCIGGYTRVYSVYQPPGFF